jgi:hypothetical protein
VAWLPRSLFWLALRRSARWPRRTAKAQLDPTARPAIRHRRTGSKPVTERQTVSEGAARHRTSDLSVKLDAVWILRSRAVRTAPRKPRERGLTTPARQPRRHVQRSRASGLKIAYERLGDWPPPLVLVHAAEAVRR